MSGAIRLHDADIAGQLLCSGAKLNGHNEAGSALAADRIKVGGGLFLDDELTASGAIRLSGADIAGQLVCSGAKLNGCDSGGNALVADGIKVGGLFLNDEFTASGAIRLTAADIAVQLVFRGAKLNGRDDDGDALVADAIKVGGGLFVDEDFAASGVISLMAADVAVQLVFRGAKLNGRDDDGYALVADAIKVGGGCSSTRTSPRPARSAYQTLISPGSSSAAAPS
jgi:hypothetical protein